MRTTKDNMIEILKLIGVVAFVIGIIYGVMILDKAILTSDMPWWLKWLLIG